MADDTEGECLLLTRLPGELRATIWEHVLSFERPLKLRQVVAGSKNTGILRTCQQIYAETLPVLYDVNQIMCTRNDFCHYTDSTLQTPMRKDQVRNLLVKNFSQSIKCSSYSGGNNMFLAGCCEVCQPTATGFLQALTELPKLRTVVVDYHDHTSEFAYMKEVIRRNGKLETLRRHRALTCTGMAQYRLHGSSIPESLTVTFTDAAFNKVWTTLSKMENGISVYGMSHESDVLEQMRADIDRDLPDKLYVVFCAKKSVHWPSYGKLHTSWNALDQATSGGRDAAEEMEALYEEVVRLTKRQTRSESLLLLTYLRSEEATAMEIMRMS